MRTTRTFVEMDVSPQTFAEVKAKLEEADYYHAISEEDGKILLDMHGIALVKAEKA